MSNDELRQQQLRYQVVAARDAVELQYGAARRYRATVRLGVIGVVVGATGFVGALVGIVLSAWIDFGRVVLPLLFIVTLLLLGLSLSFLTWVLTTGQETLQGRQVSPTDQFRILQREYDEAYAAYLETGPVNAADAYLQPRDGRKTR